MLAPSFLYICLCKVSHSRRCCCCHNLHNITWPTTCVSSSQTSKFTFHLHVIHSLSLHYPIIPIPSIFYRLGCTFEAAQDRRHTHSCSYIILSKINENYMDPSHIIITSSSSSSQSRSHHMQFL